MPRVLTARFVETVTPQRVRKEYADAGALGLYLVVQPTGAKSWAVRYRRPDGRPAKLTLGDADTITLAAAREQTAKARNRVTQGIEPASRRQVSDATAGDSIEHWAARFLAEHVSRHNRDATAEAAERTINDVMLPVWRGRTVSDIKRRDVIDLIEHVGAERGPYAAIRARAVLSKFFRWLMARDIIVSSPCEGVAPPHQPKARKRSLNDAELKALLAAANSGDPSERAFWIMALTGCRRNEIGLMKWSDLDSAERTWTIPGEVSKNHIEHQVPLSREAWNIIEAQPRLAGCEYVFSAYGRGPVNNWVKTKKRLSKLAGIEEDSWRLHDLRRTTAAGLQRLKVPVPVIETALGHKSGTFRGIIGVYQVHDYRDEVRAALQAWGSHVSQLVAAPSTAVAGR